MITTILAIYGAVVSTASVLLSFWFFRATGPRLQAQASCELYLLIHEQGREQPYDTGDRTLIMKVWNTGRHPIKVEIGDLTVTRPTGGSTHIGLDWHGPEIPISMPGHSGEQWQAMVTNLIDELGQPFDSNIVTIQLIEAGRRERAVRVPVTQLHALPVEAKWH